MLLSGTLDVFTWPGSDGEQWARMAHSGSPYPAHVVPPGGPDREWIGPPAPRTEPTVNPAVRPAPEPGPVPPSDLPVLAIPPAGHERVVEVLARAFAHYPVIEHVLGPGARDAERVQRLVRFFVQARALRNEPLLGIPEPEADERLAAAAIASLPEAAPPPELARLREALWAELGPDARARYEACGEAWAGTAPPGPRMHLNMLGVAPPFRRQGLAARLLREVHRLAAARPGTAGVSLTTEDPANVPFYQAAGYRLVGRVRIAPALESWSFFRPVRPGDGGEGGIASQGRTDDGQGEGGAEGGCGG